MSAIRVIDVQAVWFTEAASGGNALNLHCPTEGTPHAFWADIALDRPRRMRFERVAWMDGEGIYQATESRPDVCWIAAQNEPLVKLRMIPITAMAPARDDGMHGQSPSSDWDEARDQRARENDSFRALIRGVENGLGTLDACQMEASLPSLRREMRAVARRNARDLHYKPVVPSRLLTDEEWLSHPAEVSEVFRAIGMGTVDDPVQWLYTLKVAMEYAEATFAERVARNPATGIEP
ncbi:hypothetical protein [Komagataeibacter xylinus]|uniref:hypothetical protein n=1 Tax=Komagataeibacter xylinus TaxID=28448 RepID=UPI00280C1C4E|nr:hypothetical protein [Komagataeibacter xylinus]